MWTSQSCSCPHLVGLDRSNKVNRKATNSCLQRKAITNNHWLYFWFLPLFLFFQVSDWMNLFSFLFFYIHRYCSTCTLFALSTRMNSGINANYAHVCFVCLQIKRSLTVWFVRVSVCACVINDTCDLHYKSGFHLMKLTHGLTQGFMYNQGGSLLTGVHAPIAVE